MEKKKVCMLLHGIYQQDARVKNYVTALLKKDYEVFVICLKKEGNKSADIEGLHIIELPLRRNRSRGYILETGISLFLFTIYTLFSFIKYRYNVIHVHNMPDFLILAALFPKLFGCKLILDIHDPMPEFFVSKYKKNNRGLVQKILIFEEKICVSIANIVITANENFRNALIDRGIPKEKIFVIINIANPDIFIRQSVSDPGNSKYILIFPGTLAARYGLELPVKALPELLKHIPNILVRLVGDKNEYTDSLVQLAEKLGVQDHFEIFDMVPLEKLPPLLSNADIGIYPAMPDPHMSIATPGKALEYAAMGLPIVSSRLKAMTIYFSDECVLYFEPGNITEFTNCILDLYKHPELVERLVVNNQKKFVDVYTFKKENEKYISIMNELLS